MTLKTTDYQSPFIWFNKWFSQAKANVNIKEPTAMALSTINEENKPSLRIVLLKKFDESGFCFFTNLTSRKGREISFNSNVALCFYWQDLGYQIRIEGEAEKVSIKEADDYFSTRQRQSQIGAWASKQSQAIENEGDFQKRIDQISKDFEGQEIPRPPFWSGFRVKPKSIEFWEEGDFRIHKRTRYKLLENGQGWKVEELYP